MLSVMTAPSTVWFSYDTVLGKDVKLEPGYWTEWAGEYERLSSATARLLIVIPIALALILAAETTALTPVPA